MIKHRSPLTLLRGTLTNFAKPLEFLFGKAFSSIHARSCQDSSLSLL